MRINIKTRMPMPEIPPEIDLETGKLGDLLLKVFGGTHFAREIIGLKTGSIELQDNLDVTLNGISHHTLAKGLDTELHDGDTVGISMIMLGGG
jgi:hypothetical protein